MRVIEISGRGRMNEMMGRIVASKGRFDDWIDSLGTISTSIKRGSPLGSVVEVIFEEHLVVGSIRRSGTVDHASSSVEDRRRRRAEDRARILAPRPYE